MRVQHHLPEELIAAIDSIRGDQTRSKWIEAAARKALPRDLREKVPRGRDRGRPKNS